MRINRVFRVISLVLVIVPIIMLLLFNVILTGSSDSFYSTNYIAFAVIEIINIVFAVLIFASKDKVRRPLLVLFIVFAIATFLVPVFCIEHTFAPEGPDSYLMGLGLYRQYRDIYGVNITELAEFFGRYI